ncbi:MAG: vWA domain-containing protein [Bacteroidota bacterium]
MGFLTALLSLILLWGSAVTIGLLSSYLKLDLESRSIKDFFLWLQDGRPQDWRISDEPGVPWLDSTGESPKSRKKSANLYVDDIINNAGFSKANVIEVSKKIGEEEIEVGYPTGNFEIRPIQSMDEIPDLLHEQQAYPDDMFFEQLAQGELYVQKDIESKEVFSKEYSALKKHRVVVVDCSGSMLGDNSFRIDFTIKLAKAFVQNAQRNKAISTLIFFSSEILDTFTAQSADDYRLMLAALDDADKYRGGTNLDKALMHALDRFETYNMYDDAQVIMITDGTEGINSRATRERMSQFGVKLHTVCVGKYHRQLHRLSDEFYLFYDEHLKMR